MLGMLFGSTHTSILLGILPYDASLDMNGLLAAIATLFSGIIAFAGAWHAGRRTERHLLSEIRDRKIKEASTSLELLENIGYAIINVKFQLESSAVSAALKNDLENTAVYISKALFNATKQLCVFNKHTSEHKKYCNVQTQLFISKLNITCANIQSYHDYLTGEYCRKVFNTTDRDKELKKLKLDFIEIVKEIQDSKELFDNAITESQKTVALPQ